MSAKPRARRLPSGNWLLITPEHMVIGETLAHAWIRWQARLMGAEWMLR